MMMTILFLMRNETPLPPEKTSQQLLLLHPRGMSAKEYPSLLLHA